jgi:CheY-like chemotaxis protein
VPESSDDDLLASLDFLADVLMANARRSEALVEEIRLISEGRRQGQHYRELLSLRPTAVLDLTRASVRSLVDGSRRVQLSAAQALHDEGMTMGAIGRLLGVTRQRISALLKNVGRDTAMEHVRVLVVDDEEDMRTLVRLTITGAWSDVSVSEAHDGNGAIREWRAGRPHVVVLDNRMPDASGIDTARMILDESPGQAIVLFTAYPSDEVQEAAAAAGIRACLSKSDVQQLPELVRALAVHGGSFSTPA